MQSDGVLTKTLIFSEEYVKITKGMFAVWTSHARQTARTRPVVVLLNHEHWGFAEASAALGAGDRVVVERLPFDLPSTWLRRTLTGRSQLFLVRALCYALERALDLGLSPLIVLLLYRRLRRIRPGAVFSHTGGWPAGVLCRWIICAARLARVPKRILVVHSHPRPPAGKLAALLEAPLRRLSARAVGSCATAIVTVSDTVREVLESEVFRRPVVRIYNGIDPAPAARDAVSLRSPLPWQASGLAVGFVGALYPLKGAHVLLDAFRAVHVPCELALLGPAAGREDYVRSLHQRAAACAHRVTFIGYHDDVDAFMQQIDVLVVPSIAYESFGLVILEAMKHAKPVICSDFGGMKEVVEHGVTGLVVPAGDAAALAGALERLLLDAGARRRMGDAGHQRLEQLFTSERMAQQYDSLIVGC